MTKRRAYSAYYFSEQSVCLVWSVYRTSSTTTNAPLSDIGGSGALFLTKRTGSTFPTLCCELKETNLGVYRMVAFQSQF